MTLAFDGVGLREGNIAAPDARLVRHDDEGKAETLHRLEPVDRAGQKLDVVRVRRIVPVDDDSPVAVEENGWLGHQTSAADDLAGGVMGVKPRPDGGRGSAARISRAMSSTLILSTPSTR